MKAPRRATAPLSTARRALGEATAFDGGWREFITPEGVDLRLQVGAYVERAIAFLIDAAILGAVLLAFTVVLLLALGGAAAAGLPRLRIAGEVVAVVWLLGSFLLRNFYFVGFEARAGAATPGKRRMGLRVAARDGGPLSASAVFARNAMRELEIFLPATFLFARGQGVDGWILALGAVWAAVFVVFPLFNRDRLRLGDLAAGTIVVKAPRLRLLPDLADRADGGQHLGLRFTPAQLDVYGEKELQVLEQVLRVGDRAALADVARRIRRKIDWTGPIDVSDQAFLSAYYAALRGRLEAGLLFGRRRRDKFDRP